MAELEECTSEEIPCDNVGAIITIEEEERAGNGEPNWQDKEFSIFCLETIEQLKEKCEKLGIKGNFDYKPPHKRSKRGEKKPTQEIYEVEDIVDYKITDDVYFFVKWKDWDSSTNTWEPLENLTECDEILADFRKRSHMMLTYEDPFKSIIQLQCLLERITADRYSDPAILLKLCDISLDSFQNRKSEMLQMKKQIKGKLKLINECLREDFDSKQIPYTVVLNYVLRNLNVFKHFKDLEELCNFVERRKNLLVRLKRWELDLNNQIKEETNGTSLAVQNFVDLEGPPENFTYITSCKVDSSVIFVDEDPPIWCECDNCFENRSQCCPGTMEARFAYTKNGTLRLPPQNPIYECNKKCKCKPNCPNRVIQKGRQHKVAIFRTDNGCGWGVKALEPIPKGRFIMEYVGEIITVEEADRRGKAYDEEGRIYLFDLDFTDDGDCLYAIDAAHYGDISHFVNHSCDPNLEVYVAWINNYNMRLSRIAFFSRRNIKIGEQLTFDYKATSPYRHSEPSNGNYKLDIATNKPPIIQENGPKVIVEPVDMQATIPLETTMTMSKSGDISETVLPNGLDHPPLINGGLHPEEAGLEEETRKNNITLESELSSPKTIIQESIPLQPPREEETLPTLSPSQPPPPSLTSKRILCKCGAPDCRYFLF